MSEQRRVRLIYGGLVLGTFLLYCPVIRHNFIGFDDPQYVVANWHIQQGLGWNELAWAFSSKYAANWHPLTWISHAMDWQIYGTEHPGGHHLTNLLFHLANTLLLFEVLRRMTKRVWPSAMVAALFAWHPLHVESVAWIAERKDVLSTFFWLLTFLAYERYVTELNQRSPKARTYYAWTLGFFALGLMSKPMVVTLPFTLLLLDFWPLRRTTWFGVGRAYSGERTEFHELSWPRLIWEKWPFFILSAIASTVTYLVQHQAGATMDVTHYPPAARAVGAVLAYAGYLKKMFWPARLSIFYPYADYFPYSEIALSLLVLGTISLAAILWARSRPYLLVGWLWYLGTLVPVIGLVQVGAQAMADRYTYMPLTGIFIAVVWSVDALTARWGRRGPALAAVSALVLIGCAAVTSRQLSYWRNTFSLFTHVEAVTAPNPVTETTLGLAYDDRGEFDQAMAHYQRALKLAPDYCTTYYFMGLNYAARSNFPAAIESYAKAIQTGSDTESLHFNMGNSYAGEDRLEDAAAQYAQAVALDPDFPQAHNNFGAVLMRLGRLPDALAQFKEALRLKPDYPEAQDQMGSVLLKLGHPDLAELHYREAVRLKPDFAHAQLKLGLAMASQGKLQEALLPLQTAVKLEPQNADAGYNLAADYAALGRFEDAARIFGDVAKQNPNDADARARQAGALAGAGKMDEAIAAYRAALQLKPDLATALRELAWILATNPRAEFRDGPEAVRLAARADELTSHQQPLMLSTLDAAYAEAGRFDDAIKTAQLVQQLATAHNAKAMADQAAARIELYRAGKAFHE